MGRFLEGRCFRTCKDLSETIYFRYWRALRLPLQIHLTTYVPEIHTIIIQVHEDNQVVVQVFNLMFSTFKPMMVDIGNIMFRLGANRVIMETLWTPWPLIRSPINYLIHGMLNLCNKRSFPTVSAGASISSITYFTGKGSF